jgi:hypothetical protein
MPEINWGALETPDFVGNALKARALGQHDATLRARDNALQQYAKPGRGDFKSLMAVDPEAALQLRKNQREDATYQARTKVASQLAAGDTAGATTTAAGAGDVDLMGAIGKMTAEQRKEALERADHLAAAVSSLDGLTYEQRKAQLPALAQRAPMLGLKPEDILNYDPTDENNATLRNSVLGTKGMLEQHNKEQSLGLQRDQFAETKRAHRASEATAQGNLGVRRQEFQERKRAGGFGTPGAPAAAAGTWEEIP